MKTLNYSTDYTSNPIPAGTSADDLTALLAQEKLERTLANIARRASTLWEDGYTQKQSFQGSFVRAYDVFSPKGDRYMVKITPTPKDIFLGDKCTCPSFENFGDCKHHIAILQMVALEDQADDYDEDEAEGEFGTDPYAEY